MSNVVGERFQITIDKSVREALGIRPGDRAVERVEDGRLVIEFAPAPHRTSLRGLFRDAGRTAPDDWQTVRERAWAARTAEIAEALDSDASRHGQTR